MKFEFMDQVFLRPVNKNDAVSMLAWENDPDHWLVSNRSAPLSLHQIEAFIESDNDVYANGQQRFMICAGEEAVGCIDLSDFDPKNHRVGIGVLVDKAHRKCGYASAAVARCVEFAFEGLLVNTVFAEVPASNAASIALFMKSGFELVGTRRAWLWTGDGYEDQHIFQKLKR